MSSLRRLLDRLALIPRTIRRPAAPRNPRTPLFLEVLEDRLSPATNVGSVAAATVSSPPAAAAVSSTPTAPDVWSGAGSNADWTNGQNWIGGVAPVPGQALSFPTTAVAKDSCNDCNNGTTFGPITIDGSGYHITGNTVNLQGGLTADNNTGDNTVALGLTFSTPQTITAANTGTTLNLAGSIDNGASTLTINGSGYVLFTGSSISGSGGLTDNDNTRVMLLNSAGNTCNGTTTVNAGTLYLGAAQGNAITGDLVIGDNQGPNEADVVRLAGNNQISSKAAVTITSTGLLDLNGYDNTLGPLTMTGGDVTTGTGTLTLTQGLTTLAPPSQAPHADAIIDGNLSLGTGNTPQTFNIAQSGTGLDLDVKTNVSGGAGVNAIKEGDGTMKLSGDNTYAGATVVKDGVLALDNAQALGGSSGTTVDSGGTLQLQGGLSFAPPGTLTLNGSGFGGAGALHSAGGDNAWDGNIILGSTAAVAADAGTTLTLNGVLSGSISSNLQADGDGTIVLTGTNTNFLGCTEVQSGFLALENATALGPVTKGMTVDSGATLQLVGGIDYGQKPLILNGTGVGGTAGALENVSGGNTWEGPVVLDSDATIKSDAGSTLTDHVQIGNEGYNLTVDGSGDVNLDTTISGAGGLTKDGSGTLTLGGSTPNLYTGATVVKDGTLNLAKVAGVDAITGAGLTIDKDGTLTGSGTMDTSVTNSGVVSPGGADSVGTLVITGNYTQNPGGTLDMELASKKAFDQLMIQGAAGFDGTLNLGLLNGFEPAPGDLFPILTFSSFSDKFGTINLPKLTNGAVLDAVYDPQDLTIAAESSS
jgi:fibronectin-binding autotransporter adhesin